VIHSIEQETSVPKYMLQASYTADGVRGLMKDTASGRRNAVKAGIKAVGGKLEGMYYCFGGDDVMVLMDLPDNIAAASLVAAVAASGLVHARTTPLLSVEEMDKALAKKATYKGPGSAS
jgi:uncharacterized protein with GYD domain